MARRIDGELNKVTAKKTLFPDEWFDGTQWEITWGWNQPDGDFDIPATCSSPSQRLRYAANQHGKKLKIYQVSKNPWVFRIQAYCDRGAKKQSKN